MVKRRGSGSRGGGDPAGPSRMERDFAVSGLPDYLEAQRTRVFCGADSNTSAKHFGSAHSYVSTGYDNSQTWQEFENSLKISVRKLDDEMIEFDLVGVSPAFANALRRILISEVPTMAIEHVFFLNNTSTIPDEIVSHRLGLIPIRANPSQFKFRNVGGEEDSKDQRNTIVLKLHCACRGRKETSDDPKTFGKVLSSQLEWMPEGSEIPEETDVRFTVSQDKLPTFDAVAPVHGDILIAKLSSGQEIELEAHCTKGTGAEHAKWSPVATAWYRLCPEVVLLKPVAGKRAEDLIAMFPNSDACPFEMAGDRAAVKSNAEPALESLERVRALSGDPKWSDIVQLRKIKNHFIFTIETTGVVAPQDLLVQALDILQNKALNFATGL